MIQASHFTPQDLHVTQRAIMFIPVWRQENFRICSINQQ
jgi:hypothetical protein